MNEIVNKSLLSGSKFILEMYLSNLLRFIYCVSFTVLVDHWLKTKKGHTNSKKQEIHDLFVKISKLQWCIKYFEAFWYFTNFSFYHKWHNDWLLVINMVYRNCITTWPNDLRFRKVENYERSWKSQNIIEL